jgi:hypothetical protein
MNNQLIDNDVGNQNRTNTTSKMNLANQLQLTLFASEKTAFGAAVSLA